MGQVPAAHDTVLQRQVAIKTLFEDAMRDHEHADDGRATQGLIGHNTRRRHRGRT
jgi:hypothetical protein